MDISEKCHKRLPERTLKSGYKISSLCDLPKGHDGECRPDEIEEKVLDKALPEIEEKYYPKKG